MGESIFNAIGIIPAIIFPGAALIQLLALLKSGRAGGVSVITWWLFAVANICAYLYSQKYLEIYSILMFLGTATLNISVALTAARMKKREAKA